MNKQDNNYNTPIPSLPPLSEEENLENIYAHIKRKALVDGITIKDACVQMGVNESTISRMKKGQMPSGENCFAILKWLGALI